MDGTIRSPHGECGLKSLLYLVYIIQDITLPARGVRIEITRSKMNKLTQTIRSLHGECGLKSETDA